jgi:hypothetical protein
VRFYSLSCGSRQGPGHTWWVSGVCSLQACSTCWTQSKNMRDPPLVAVQVAMAKNRPSLPAVDPASCPPELVTLLDDCFSFNPRERPSSGEVMKLMAHMMRTHLPEIS